MSREQFEAWLSTKDFPFYQQTIEHMLWEAWQACEKIKNEEIATLRKEHRDDLRSLAAEASHSERYPDAPYGTY